LRIEQAVSIRLLVIGEAANLLGHGTLTQIPIVGYLVNCTIELGKEKNGQLCRSP
jgi:hypothetical protein